MTEAGYEEGNEVERREVADRDEGVGSLATGGDGEIGFDSISALGNESDGMDVGFSGTSLNTRCGNAGRS